MNLCILPLQVCNLLSDALLIENKFTDVLADAQTIKHDLTCIPFEPIHALHVYALTFGLGELSLSTVELQLHPGQDLHRDVTKRLG